MTAQQDVEFDDFEVQAFLKDDIEKILYVLFYPHECFQYCINFLVLTNQRNSNLRESFEMSLKNDFGEYQKNQQLAAQYQTLNQEPTTPYGT
jgi:hypothetical protein